MLFGALAQAQTAGTVTLTANRTTATGSLTPVLTWSTTPVASSCVASGAWSGTKFASGTETLPTITSNKSYTLTCTWGGSGTATLTWTAPKTNSNGSTLTDLTGYKIVYGNSSTSLTKNQAVNDAKATSATVPGLAAGNWYFAVRALNSKGAESANSNVMQKSIAGASAAKTVNITITSSTPAPTSLKTVSTSVYDVVSSNGTRTLGKLVGNIALGKACDSSYSIGSRYRVTRSDVKFSVTPRSNSVVAWCKVQ
jgi:fibronectin type III domain protein